MTDEFRGRAAAFAKFLANVPDDKRDQINEANQKEAAEQHAAFRQKFGGGQCSFCGEALSAFDVTKPCPHWLLKPKGFEKDHMLVLAQSYGWQRLEGYLRWVANEEAFAQNINDLKDEGTGKLVELTIKYRDYEWSFSCAANDLNGHQTDSAASQQPHYHFQMRINGQPFIRYNDFHLPLTVQEAGFLMYSRDSDKPVKRRLMGGAGMSEVFAEEMLERLVKFGRSGESESDVARAPIELNTIITAEPGKSIKGEDLYRLIQSAKAEGVTVSSKFRELEGVRIHTLVSPGPGVVKQAVRAGRNRRSKVLRDEDRVWRELQKRQRD